MRSGYAHSFASPNPYCHIDGASKSGEEKDDAKSGGDSKKKDDGLSFEKEDVEPISFHEVSLLDKILKGSSVSLGPKPVMMGTDGAVLHLTIYLPTRTEMKIDVRVLCSPALLSLLV